MSDRTVKNSQIFTEVQAELSTKLSSALEDLLPLIASDLDEFRENTRDADDKRTLLDASSALRLDSRKRINNFSQDLAENAGRTLVAGLLADADNRKPVLVDGKERSQKSLVEELTGSIRQLRAGDYAEFASLVRAISPKDWDDDDLNPLGARMLASSLASTFRDLTTSPSVNAAVRLSLSSRYTDAVLDVLAGCSSRMVRHRVKPAPVPRMDASVPERAGSERKPDGTRQAGGAAGRPEARRRRPDSESTAAFLEDHASGEQRARPEFSPEGATRVFTGVSADARRLGTSALAGLREDIRLRALPDNHPVRGMEDDALVFAHSVGEQPYSRGARQSYFREVRERLASTDAGRAQIGVVDVVAAMFDYIVDDKVLAKSTKPLFWRMQRPALVLSLLDPEYLGEGSHSLRRLLENFGMIANVFSDQFSESSELFERMEMVVRALEMVSSALQNRTAAMSARIEKTYGSAANNIGRLNKHVSRERHALEAIPNAGNRRDYSNRPARERERAVTDCVKTLLEERLSKREFPESVHEFLQNVWSRHMRTAVLRDGQESHEFKVTLQVVDDLLWSLNGSRHEKRERISGREFAGRIPPLVRLLTEGLHQTGAREVEHQHFFDDLLFIHLRRMKKRRRRAKRSRSAATALRSASESRRTRNHEDMPAHGRTTATLTDSASAERRLSDGERGDSGRVNRTKIDRADQAARPFGADTSDHRGDGGARHRFRPSSSSRRRRPFEPRTGGGMAELRRKNHRRLLDPQATVDGLRPGDWLELTVSSGEQRLYKVAWISEGRSTVLLVRSPGGKKRTLRMAELLARFVEGRAQAMESPGEVT